MSEKISNRTKKKRRELPRCQKRLHPRISHCRLALEKVVWPTQSIEFLELARNLLKNFLWEARTSKSSKSMEKHGKFQVPFFFFLFFSSFAVSSNDRWSWGSWISWSWISLSFCLQQRATGRMRRNLALPGIASKRHGHG